jgi:hypothetical protein
MLTNPVFQVSIYVTSCFEVPCEDLKEKRKETQLVRSYIGKTRRINKKTV